jgi:uncharacterized protein YdaU (DUF1376 family)
MLELCYDTEKPLNSDPVKIGRRILAVSEEEKTALKMVLEEFFVLQEDGWHNARCDAEIAKYQGQIEQASRAGKASAAKRYGKNLTPVEQPFNQPEPEPEPNSSSLRSEESAAKPQRTSSRPKRDEVTLAKYLEACKTAGQKPVPDDHYIRAWCGDAHIPVDMLQVGWVVFREKYLNDEKLKGKRYKDWPGHFATSVKDRWYGLWFTGEDGKPVWSSTGLQRKQVLEAQQTKPKKESELEPA